MPRYSDRICTTRFGVQATEKLVVSICSLNWAVVLENLRGITLGIKANMGDQLSPLGWARREGF